MDSAGPVGSQYDVRRMPRRTNWTTSSDAVLVDLLSDESTQSGVSPSSFRPEQWVRVWNFYQKLTKEDTTLIQFKGRWKTLKKLYRLHASLLGKSGWSWDLDNQRPTPGSAAVWEDIIMLNKEYKVCRDKPFPLYQKIYDLVASSTATGEYACHTGATAKPDDVVHDLDEGSGSSDSPVQEVRKDTNPSRLGKEVSNANAVSGSKRKQTVDRSSQLTKRTLSEHTVETLNRLMEMSDRRSRFLEKTKAVTDPYSYQTSMEKLFAIPCLNGLELFAAADALKSPEHRTFFMMMPAHVIGFWLQHYVAEYRRQFPDEAK